MQVKRALPVSAQKKAAAWLGDAQLIRRGHWMAHLHNGGENGDYCKESNMGVQPRTCYNYVRFNGPGLEPYGDFFRSATFVILVSTSTALKIVLNYTEQGKREAVYLKALPAWDFVSFSSYLRIQFIHQSCVKISTHHEVLWRCAFPPKNGLASPGDA